MFKASGCICTKVTLMNSTGNILLQLSKGKQSSTTSGVAENKELNHVPPNVYVLL